MSTMTTGIDTGLALGYISPAYLAYINRITSGKYIDKNFVNGQTDNIDIDVTK